MRLGGMANGIDISGSDIVAWTFTTKDGSEVQINTEAYYVPGAKQRIMSTQRLFNKKKGFLGPSVEMKRNLNYILMIIQSFQFLMTAVYHCLSHKLFMLYGFCHLNFQSLQHVLQRAPFVAIFVAVAVKCAPPRCELCEMAQAKHSPQKAK
jgi:hypothetical protein